MAEIYQKVQAFYSIVYSESLDLSGIARFKVAAARESSKSCAQSREKVSGMVYLGMVYLLKKSSTMAYVLGL